MKERNDKSKKLEEKIDLLVEKMEKEQSRIKRLAYSIKCKMLVAKLDREINLQNAMEEFEKQKEENEIIVKEEKIEARTRIISINQTIAEVNNEIISNSQYDFLSSNFMFPKEEVTRAGGIGKYIEELKNSGRPEQQEAARKIIENAQRRKKLIELKKQLEQEKEELDNQDKTLETQNKAITKKQKELERKNKLNVFVGIGDFATATSSGVKEYLAESAENKMLSKEKAEKLNELKGVYKASKENIKKEYEEKMKSLNEEYKNFKQGIKDEYKDRKQEQSQAKRSEQEVNLQNQVKNETKKAQNNQTKKTQQQGQENKDNQTKETTQQTKVNNDKIIVTYNAKSNDYIIKNAKLKEEIKVNGNDLRGFNKESLIKKLGVSVKDLETVDLQLFEVLYHADKEWNTKKAEAYFNIMTEKSRRDAKKLVKNSKMKIIYNLKGLYDKEIDVESNEKVEKFTLEERVKLINSANKAGKLEIANVKKGLKVHLFEIADDFKYKFEVNKNKTKMLEASKKEEKRKLKNKPKKDLSKKKFTNKVRRFTNKVRNNIAKAAYAFADRIKVDDEIQQNLAEVSKRAAAEKAANSQENTLEENNLDEQEETK